MTPLPTDDCLKPRLFVTAPLAGGSTVTLAAAQTHYLAHVLRLKPGETVRLFNGRDGEWLGGITAVTKKALTVTLQTQLRPQPAAPDLWLCAAPIKKAHFDYLIEKATELGISTLQPMLTQRCQIREVNVERACAIAVESAEQSERLDVPEINPPQKLAQLAAQWPSDRLPIICAEWGEAQPVAEAFRTVPRIEKAALFTGPEGGFTAEELDVLRNLPNALFIRLGPRILRADTAAIAALSCWQAMRGDWR